jgi:hypothetical protein
MIIGWEDYHLVGRSLRSREWPAVPGMAAHAGLAGCAGKTIITMSAKFRHGFAAALSLCLCVVWARAELSPSATAVASAVTQSVDATRASTCATTLPNGETPPAERPSPGHHGNGQLWVSLWSDGVVVFQPGGSGFVLPDGSLQMKFPWWRGVAGPLTISGRRIDANAPPLGAYIPHGYGDSGFQATSLIFPTPGCWEVTGRAGEASLTFTVDVVKIGDGPLQNGLPPNFRRQR